MPDISNIAEADVRSIAESLNHRHRRLEDLAKDRNAGLRILREVAEGRLDALGIGLPTLVAIGNALIDTAPAAAAVYVRACQRGERAAFAHWGSGVPYWEWSVEIARGYYRTSESVLAVPTVIQLHSRLSSEAERMGTSLTEVVTSDEDSRLRALALGNLKIALPALRTLPPKRPTTLQVLGTFDPLLRGHLDARPTAETHAIAKQAAATYAALGAGDVGFIEDLLDVEKEQRPPDKRGEATAIMAEITRAVARSRPRAADDLRALALEILPGQLHRQRTLVASGRL